MKMPRRVATVSTLLLASATTALLAQAPSAPAAAPRPASPAGAPHGGGATVVTARLARLDALLQSYVDQGQLAGVVALVLKDGRPIYQKAVGYADREAKRPMRMDTIFRIASQTKAITSVAVLTLVEEGKLGIGDPVSRYIPSFAKTTVMGADGTTTAARRQITIKDLLTHTAGISYGVEPSIAELYRAKGLGPAAGAGWYFADKNEPICDVIERLGTLPFVAQPGEAWVYGYNTDILGCVIEKVTGQGLDKVIAARVTGPLGMKDTQFFLPAAQRDRLATVYASQDGKAVRAAEGAQGQGSYVEGPRRTLAGGAGLLSTVADYGRFLDMIRRGGVLDGVRILSPRTVALMSTNQVGTLHSPSGMGFGLGFETTERYGANNLDPVGAFGWAGAYGTQYRIDPSSGLVSMVMIQQLPNATDIRDRFLTVVQQALVDTPRVR
jgi:CubicO group peptidase (beta-lactamase class C family)